MTRMQKVNYQLYYLFINIISSINLYWLKYLCIQIWDYLWDSLGSDKIGFLY